MDGNYMGKKIQGFLEGVVVVAIILVLFQTFLEDFAVLFRWPWDIRRVLTFTGFGFDLFFTVEFLIRFYSASSRGEARTYLLRERGWIDFMASVPLLMFNSGPSAAALILSGRFVMSAGGVLNMLKVIKAIRIARVLRLLRIIKVFRQIKYADSPMAQRHVAKVTSLSVTTVVFTILGFTILGMFFPIASLESFQEKETKHLLSEIESSLSVPEPARGPGLAEFLRDNEEVLILNVDGSPKYSRYSNDYYNKWFGPDDYRYMKGNGYEAFIDIREFNGLQARDNLLYFAVIIFTVLMFLILYSPHFAMTVSDPINVMRKGMENESYNLEVKEDPRYAEDDIFALSRAYNDIFLPLKNRQSGESKSGMLSMSDDDIQDLFKG